MTRERRSFLRPVYLGRHAFLPLRRRAHATPEALAAAIKEVTGGAPLREGKVTLDIPPLVENGNAVPLTVKVDSPMTADDHVKAIHIFNEKNPQPHVFNAWLSPANGQARGCDPHQARRQPEGRGGRRDQQGRVLVGAHRRDRHHRRLHRGRHLMANVLVNAPKTAKKGQVVEIKALIMHVMETGYRPGTNGRIIPRNIIQDFTATWNGREIFRMKMSPAIAANPFVSFFGRRERKRHHRLPLERRRGLRRRAPGRHHGDMRGLPTAAVLLAVFTGSLALALAQGDGRRSGYQDMSPALQKMQDDDTANPAMLFVQSGETLWNEKAGTAGKSCADCHNDATASMKGVAARYPAVAARPASRSISRVASTSVARTASKRPRWQRKATICWRCRPMSRCSRAASRSRRRTTCNLQRCAQKAQKSTSSAKASSISAAPTATMTMPRRSSLAQPFRRAIRPAIRSIAWNGRRWAR